MSKLLPPWLSIVALVLLLAGALQAQPTEPGYIRLARLTGTVTLEDRSSGERRDARDVREIEQGVIVITDADSSVILVFSNGSTVNLGASSRLDVEEFLQDPFADELRPSQMIEEPTVSRTKLNLTQGELVGNVKTLRKEAGSAFTVQTPAGAAGIRGTTFRIVFRPDGTGQAFFSLTTLEGEIGFSTLTGTVDLPQALVADNQEVVVSVTVDDQTGSVTVLTPANEIAAQSASAAEIASITEAVQQVTEAVAEVVLTPKPMTSETPPEEAEEKTEEESEEETAEESSEERTEEAAEENSEESAEDPTESAAERTTEEPTPPSDPATPDQPADSPSQQPTPPSNSRPSKPLPPVLNQPNQDLTPGDGRAR